MTVLMSRDVSNFPVQVQLFRLLSFMYVESRRDYLTVESKDVVSCKVFSVFLCLFSLVLILKVIFRSI